MSPTNDKRFLIIFKETATPEAKSSCMQHAKNMRGGHVKEIKSTVIHGFSSSFSETEMIEFKSANFGDHGPIDWIEEDSEFHI
ncbi:hypothetical protein FIBSPDRAFT_1039522 [Athelia psychrophila]|uniref:Inhibitor I9 domain-containing protein n=1 Tax=Athelia psychrophila TaxID=1759441 RepID=A0A166RKY4_9AGAM|nr:hypothetical protein FIBSPDRAFT_1053998 [Fibularhizoctonia sp. CBS 109695]KZP28386.1 hypothetical protein FIBSPDRAFT_1039522 [Fibularhizoctonia sp. CBS 109695]